MPQNQRKAFKVKADATRRPLDDLRDSKGQTKTASLNTVPFKPTLSGEAIRVDACLTANACFAWDEAIETFLWSRRVVGCSEKTLAWHKYSLQHLLRCHKTLALSCDPTTCPKEHLFAFLDWLRSRGVRPTSIATYFRSIRAFFRWLKSEGLRDDLPTEKMPLPKMPETLPRTVTEEHFLKSLQTLNPSEFPDLRNLALFLLAFDSGARLSELLGLRVGDIDL